MPGIFDGYKIALLDSSFFVSDFSEGVKRGLNFIKVYVADTFNSELEQYRLVLSANKQSIYDSNIRFLNENMRLNTLNLDSFGSQSEHLNNDIWGLITLLVGLDAKFVVLTANQILIQKIVLNDLNADIYDLNANGFIKSASFLALKSRYKFTEATWTTTPLNQKVGENSILYCNDGSKIILAKEIKSGLEANIYLIKGDKSSIAKVFKENKLSASKFQNVKHLLGINENLDINWAIFPSKILYFDLYCAHPAGFIEKYVSVGEDLDNNPLFLGDPFNVSVHYLQKKQSYAIELCLKIVRQICYLNVYGFYISDFNLGNFANLTTDDRNIQMWDTDSFGYDSFFGKFFSPDYVESTNHPKFDTSTKEGAIDISNDALYQFVFTVLSLGDSPFSEHTGKFKYDNPNYFAVSRKKFFPLNIWKHLEDVFRGNKEPSAEALLQQLNIAKNQMLQNPASDKTFKQLFIEVIPSYEDTIKKQEAEKSTDTTGMGNNSSLGTSTSNSKDTSSNSGTTNANSNTSSTASSGNSSTKEKPKLLLYCIIIGIIILIALLTHYEDFFTISYYGRTGNSTGEITTVHSKQAKDVSDIKDVEYIGWSQSDATADIKAAGWNVTYKDVYSAVIKKGYVAYDYYNENNKTITLEISQGLGEADDVKSTGASISVNNSDIVLNRGETVDLLVSASGDLPETFHFNCLTYTDIDTSWGDWVDYSSAEITMTANSIDDTGYVRFFVVDGESEENIGYTDIYITVY